MISIGSIFRKNSILTGLLILFSLSVHSTLFGLSKNAQDSSDNPSVARFDSANMDEVVIPLERVPVSAQALSRFESSSIDFHDHDWISRKPIEKSVRGFPPEMTIEFYGVFELSALQLCILLYQEETDRELWEPYDLGVPVDSKVSFVNGRDRNGNTIFIFDTNNNEDFSDEHAIYPENFGTVYRLLSYIATLETSTWAKGKCHR